MAFVTNDGTFATLPLVASVDRYIQLAHSELPNALVLQHMPADGKGYSLPVQRGFMRPLSRGQDSSLVVAKAATRKLEWRDMAFVCTAAQMLLFESLAATQSATELVTVVDNMSLTYLTKAVLVLPAEQYRSSYAGLQQFLLQFSLLEA